MNKPGLYLETSIVSYLTARPAKDLNTAAHQQITVEWWDTKRKNFDIYISKVVMKEAAAGDAEVAACRLKILKPLRILPLNREVVLLGKDFGRTGCVPAKAADDAIHIALAAVHGVHFLLTWNCTHINNVATIDEIRKVCENHGYGCPVICTPDEFIRVCVMKDPIIAELRKIRDAHAAKFHFNFDAIADDWLKQDAAGRRAGQKFVDLSAKAKSHRRNRPAAVKTSKSRCKS